ncbi:hypothetical protein GC163_09605 [bacterium]|nr:hypothetical protein [bacterium]
MSSTFETSAVTAEAMPPALLGGKSDTFAGDAASAPKRHTRPLSRRMMHLLRRLHLYFGLFLFPWAVLYGFTGFLFNHPQVMSEQPMASFDRSVWSGTAMESQEDLAASAQQVIEALQSHQPENTADLRLIETEPIRYANELAFATLKTDDEEIGLAIAALGNGGTIRKTPKKSTNEPAQPFPWAIGKAEPPTRNGREKAEMTSGGLVLNGSLSERLQASLPSLQTRQQLPAGPVTLTSVPDLTFVVESQGQRWKVGYNSLKGTVTGKTVETSGTPISWRRFMTRLHTAHGYPFTSFAAKWFWAIVVDVMAWIMIYWGVSGLLMWWQIKATRRLGFVMLSLSAVAAISMAIGMYGMMTSA